MSSAGLPGSGSSSGSGRASGSGRVESAGRSRRGSGWAQLGRRGDAAEDSAAQSAAVELRAVPVRGAEPPAEEHHLGDRLSSFVDGELGHDARDRVQSHLATCPECLVEADEGRAVKHLLTHTGTPAPSSTLMARLLAVAALPEDGQSGADDQDGPGGPGGAMPAGGTIGGSRLTGGSFGRGAGASFGAGALGAGSPLPGVDPRAGGPIPGFFGGRRGSGQATRTQPPAGGAPVPATPRPLAAAAETPVFRPAPARGRRFVFAAAGAFSVAAVTLGGVGSLSAFTAEERGNPTTPAVRGPGNSGVVPMTAELPVDFPVYPVRASAGAGASAVPQVPSASRPSVIPNGLNHQLLR